MPSAHRSLDPVRRARSTDEAFAIAFGSSPSPSPTLSPDAEEEDDFEGEGEDFDAAASSVGAAAFLAMPPARQAAMVERLVMDLSRADIARAKAEAELAAIRSNPRAVL